MMALFYTALGITFFVLSLVNISQFAKKVNALRNWVDYEPCVDSYMQITDYQISEIEKAGAFAGVVLAMACIIFVIVMINFIGNCCLCCCKCCNR